MADTNNLQINVGADVSNLVTNANAAAEAFDVTTLSVKECEAQIASLQELMASPAGKLNPGIAQSVAQLQAQLTSLKTTAPAVAASVATVGPSINTITTESEKAGLSLSKQKVIFTDFARAITGQGFSIRTFSSNFALVGPQVAIAAFAIYEIVKAFTKETEAQKAATAAAKEYTELLKQASGAAGEQAAKVTTLVNALNSGTLDTSQRKTALKELKSINEEYFGSLKDEKGVIEGLTNSYDEYLKRIDAIGRAKAIEAELTKAFDKKIQLELEIDPKFLSATNATIQTQIASLTKQLDQLGGKVEITPAQQQEVLTNPDSAQSKNIQQRIALQRELNSLLNGQNVLQDSYTAKVQAQIRQQDLIIKGLSEIQKSNGTFEIKPATGSSPDELKKELTVLEQIQKVQKELAEPDKRPVHQRESDASDPVQAKIFELKIGEALQNAAKDPKTKEAYDQLAQVFGQQLHKLQNPDLQSPVRVGLQDVKADDVQEVESKIEKAFGSKGLQVKVPADISLAIKGDQSLSKNDKDILLKALEDQIQHGLPIIRWTPKIQAIVNKKEISDALSSQLEDSLNKALTSSIQAGFENLGQSIGDALASGKNPIEAAGKSILSSIGDLMEKLGSAMIKYGIVKAGLDSLLKSNAIVIPGVVAIALGVAAEALGALVKGAGQSYKAFADGGIVTGPTHALIGEAGPEVVFPLNKLDQFVKGISTPSQRSQNVQVTGVISGQNLRLVQQRATNYNNQVS